MQQILIQIMDALHPEQVEDVTNRDRMPCLEARSADNPSRERPKPRMFRSHLPPDMLPLGVKNKQVKVVYVWRNPKDVLVSQYHFAQSWTSLETPQSFEGFFQQYLQGNVYMGSWFDHVKDYFFARDQLNIHFVKYEDMLKDLKREVEKVCDFLGEDLPDDAISHVVQMSTFQSMKNNPKANYKDLLETHRYQIETMRKGTEGDWKHFFTVAQNEVFDQVFREKMNDFSCSWEVEQ